MSQKHKHQCKVCPQNLCKRKVLQEHVAQSCQTYKHIVYVGDGHGDLCPCLALEHGDYILAREGYTLLNNLLGDRCDVKAEIVPWTSGFDVLQLLRMLCEWITYREIGLFYPVSILGWTVTFYVGPCMFVQNWKICFLTLSAEAM